MPSLLGLLQSGGILKDAAAAAEILARQEPPQVALLRLCDAGLLEGGLSAALSVRADELIGPLLQQMGGAARSLKVLDVRDRPGELELHVLLGESTERWAVADLGQLVHALNQLLHGVRGVRPVALLGEWEDALQLWCVAPSLLGSLLRLPGFSPENLPQLRSWVRR